jgi:hypothetical protein
MSCSWAGEVSRGTSSCGPLRSPVLVSNCAITAPVGAASPADAELLLAWRGAASSGGARMFPGGAIGLPRCGLGFFEGGKASPTALPSRCEFLCRLVPPGACGIAGLSPVRAGLVDGRRGWKLRGCNPEELGKRQDPIEKYNGKRYSVLAQRAVVPRRTGAGSGSGYVEVIGGLRVALR